MLVALAKFLLDIIIFIVCLWLGLQLVSWLSSDNLNAKKWGQKNLTVETVDSVCHLTVKIFEAELSKKIYNWILKQKLDGLRAYDSRELLKEAQMSLSLYGKVPEWSDFWAKREGATALDRKNPEAGLFSSLNREISYWAVEEIGDQYVWTPLVKYVAEHSELKNQFLAEYDALDILRMRFGSENKKLSWKFVNLNKNKAIYDITLNTEKANKDNVKKTVDWTVIRAGFDLENINNSLFSRKNRTAINIMSCNVFNNEYAVKNGILVAPAQLYKLCVKYTKAMLKTSSELKEKHLQADSNSKNLAAVGKKIQNDFYLEAQKSHLDE